MLLDWRQKRLTRTKRSPNEINCRGYVACVGWDRTEVTACLSKDGGQRLCCIDLLNAEAIQMCLHRWLAPPSLEWVHLNQKRLDLLTLTFTRTSSLEPKETWFIDLNIHKWAHSNRMIDDRVHTNQINDDGVHTNQTIVDRVHSNQIRDGGVHTNQIL